MREVVHLLHALNDRTIAAIVGCLAEQMRELGTSTAVIASCVRSGAARPEGVEVVDLGGSGRHTLPTVRALRRELGRLRPRVVFAPAVVAARGMASRPRLVGVVHNHYSTYPWAAPAVRRLIDRILLGRLDAVVGVSPGVATDLQATFPRMASRVHVVPEPLTRWGSMDNLAAETVTHPWFRGGHPVVVAVGHVHPRKDHETLVHALAHMRAAGGVVPRLAILGSDEGDHAARVRRLVRSLDLEDHVRLLGSVANPVPYVAAANALVLSSRNEGLGIVLLEAMAVGTPVVSTDAPSGPRWVLQDGRAGILTPVGDPAALGDAITRVLGDETLREQLVGAGHSRVASFTPQAVARDYLHLAAALEGPAPTGRLGRGRQPGKPFPPGGLIRIQGCSSGFGGRICEAQTHPLLEGACRPRSSG